jgi:hypothetical protein
MPIFKYFVGMGAVLLALLFVADQAWGPQVPPGASRSAPAPRPNIKIVSTLRSNDLPSERRSTPPPPVPEPELTAAPAAILAASATTTGQAASSPAATPTPAPPAKKKAKPVHTAAKQKKTKIATPAPTPADRYAGAYRHEYVNQYYRGDFFFRGGW